MVIALTNTTLCAIALTVVGYIVFDLIMACYVRNAISTNTLDKAKESEPPTWFIVYVTTLKFLVIMDIILATITVIMWVSQHIGG